MSTNEQRGVQRSAPPRLQRHTRSTDRFHVDPASIPDGMSYEWKRHTMLGQEDKQHQIGLAMNHWKPVPAARHPELAGNSVGEKAIIIDGQILMERPKYLTDEARAEDNANAARQMSDQMQRLEQDIGISAAFEQRPTEIHRSFERVEVPDDE